MRFVNKKTGNKYFKYENLKTQKEKKIKESKKIKNKIEGKHESLIYEKKIKHL